MNNDSDDDLPTELTRLLRNVDGVYTIYPTQGVLPTVVTAVVEAVRNDPVGAHLITVTDDDGGRQIVACIGTTADEGAPAVCRRAHDALRDFFVDAGRPAPTSISVRIGRVG